MRICLWLDGTAEEAAAHYIDTFGGEIESTARYGAAAAEMSGQPEGAVMAVAFTAGGQQFLGLNGGPQFRFNESISLVHSCQDQAEIDRVWDALTSGGGEESQCGWCKDRFGVSWQVVPAQMDTWFREGSAEQVNRMMQVVGPMRKLDAGAMEAAWKGEHAHA
jgi:predicted 3-demethylubiquinone-9 3-methyltransferase (glyoxalase superfamily)